ncbi:MAG: cysteine-rich CWC family protein [Acetobacteraceae bacterium]|nr:cysteine-rich CWC family protein [Acetobacteraceae bacterium]
MASAFATEKTCSRCGTAFGCGASSGVPCWCAAMPPITPTTDGSDCLCPACLEDICSLVPGDPIDLEQA